MERRTRLTQLVTACMAALLMVAGIAAIAAYVAEVTSFGDAVDRSGLFWYLPLLLIGVLCAVVAALLSWAALAAYRGHRASQQLCRIAAVVFPFLVLVFAGSLWLGPIHADPLPRPCTAYGTR